VKLDLSKILNTILLGDVLKQMRLLPDNCIDCIITSPPYWRKRNYEWDGQWGLENTFYEYLDNMQLFMDECWRVLKPTGTLFINMGDTWLGTGGDLTDKSKGHNSCTGASENFSMPHKGRYISNKAIKKLGIQAQSKLIIPHRFAITCVDKGWILHNDIIWQKMNGMPFSGQKRLTNKYENIFYFAKQQNHYFDLDGIRDVAITGNGTAFGVNTKKRGGGDAVVGTPISDHTLANHPGGKNPGDVQRFWDGFKDMPYDEYMQMCHDYFHNPDDCWDINTKPSSHNHYASYNSELIDKPIIAGCPEGGIVLDPFCGTGTTLKRAKQLGRNVIGIEGKKEYVDLANKIFSTVENRLF